MQLNLKAWINNKLQSLDLVNKWKGLSWVKKIICIAVIAIAISSTLLPQDKYHNLKQTPTILVKNGGFIDNGNGTVTHELTGLMWAGCFVGENWNNNECTGKAKVYSIAETVESIDHSFEFAGYDDWRIPTKGELESLGTKLSGINKGIWTISPGTKDNSNVIAVFYYGKGTSEDTSGVISLIRNAR